MPNPGMNIGSASNVLWLNIPTASISSSNVSNSSKTIALSSSETSTSAPIANEAENIPRKIKNKTIRFSIFKTKIVRTLECFQRKTTGLKTEKKTVFTVL
jgi:hypothetical protein